MAEPMQLDEILDLIDGDETRSVLRPLFIAWRDAACRAYGEKVRTRDARTCHHRAMLVLQMDQRASDEARNCAHAIEQMPLPPIGDAP